MLKQTGHSSLNPLFTVIASVIIAAIILVIFILPAEYGKDITGLGETLGINNMSVDNDKRTEQSLGDSSITNEQYDSHITLSEVLDHDNDPNRIEGNDHISFSKPLQFMETEIILTSDGHTEYKFDLEKGNQISYSLTTHNNKKVYIDLHGHNPETSDKDDEDLLVKYLDSQEDIAISGQFIAPFDGEHGWYLLNLQDEEITVKITASGHWNGHKLLPL